MKRIMFTYWDSEVLEIDEDLTEQEIIDECELHCCGNLLTVVNLENNKTLFED